MAEENPKISVKDLVKKFHVSGLHKITPTHRASESNSSSGHKSEPKTPAPGIPESKPSSRQKSKPLEGWEKPRLFIETDDKGKLLVNKKTDECLGKITQPVVVVSVVGLYRTGKSFLLNRLSGLGLQGFELGNTVESKTKGIWIWVVPHPKRDNCRLVLIDTEGLGDMAKVKMDHDIWIFALAILLSGTFVYNSKGAIDQKAMHDLHCVTQVAERIKVKSMSDDDIGVGEKGRNPGASSSRSEDDELKKFFPKFVWALRDFMLELEINGNVCTPDEYLEHALTANIPEAPEKGQDLKDRAHEAEAKEPAIVEELAHSAEPAVSDNQMATQGHPKDCIKDYFPKRRCFVFPIPVERTNQIKEINKLRDCELDKMFIKVVLEFCDYIFSESQVKTVFGDITTGRALAKLATIYVESIRNGNAPCIQNAVESTAKIENEQAIKESVDLYTKKFEALAIFPIFKNLKEMSDCHATCSNEAFDFFLTKSVFDSRRIYYQQLAKQIKEVYAGFSKDYEVKAAEACKTQLNELYNKIDVNNYLTTGGYSKYEAAIKELVHKYETTPHLEEVTAHLLSEFKKSKEETRQLILRADAKLTEAEKQIKDLKTEEDAKELAEKARQGEEKRNKLLKEEKEQSIKEHYERLATKAEEDRIIKGSEEEGGVFETLQWVAESIANSRIMPWNWFS